MTSLPDDDHAPSEEKVVIRFGSETIKGYIESPEWRSLEELFIAAAQGPSTSLRIRKVGETKSEDVAIGEAKAIFYVKEFDGNSHHKDLRFYKRVPIVNGIWVRVEFCDGEITEGIVHNTSRYVVEPGFFLRPTDPNGNNKLVYVPKSSLRDLRVLGLRSI